MEQIKKTPQMSSSKANEMKQAFLSSAISDIANCIQLSDTKVSIIMGSLVAFVAAILACYDPIFCVLSSVNPCSWLGVSLVIFTMLFFLSIIAAFTFGILTIRGHVSNIGYKSKWFLSLSHREYSFDAYRQDLQAMTNDDIIENMGAELYKLNDINQQKAKTMKWTLRSFASTLVTVAIIGTLLLVHIL